ncbi:MAG: ribose-phosphate pyrophosphokinase [Xanthobacteraceae bacterium]|nr:ribose-phosphate pyrophosphokinase [Xanthobacteraceae bacterium]
MRPILFPLPGNEAMADRLAPAIDAEIGCLSVRRFPDGETYLRYDTPVAQRSIVLLCTLDRPDDKFLPLMFAAEAARDLGATRVGLVAPYLAYMRQDRRFRSGEAITSACFARLLSRQVDWLVTVDPHLHRRQSLTEIYAVPTAVMHSAPLISQWIRDKVENPLLIGPDEESEQWVSLVARDADAPAVVLQKERHGDRDVSVSVPEVKRWRSHTPVLVDDIASTGRTMTETIGHLKQSGMRGPVCIAVHGIFAGTAFRDLEAAGAAEIVTTNTVPHETNRIDITGLLAQGIREMPCS